METRITTGRLPGGKSAPDRRPVTAVRTVGRAVIAGIGAALPPATRQDELWAGFFAGHYAGRGQVLAQRIFANSGVVTRHGVANPLLEDVSGWSTAHRMRRYLLEALPLATQALRRALDDAGIAPEELGLLTVCSCTGYVTPGLDILLARDVRLAADCQRLFVGHMGCYAALPGLSAASDFVAASGRPAAVVCAELTSLHLQPPTVDAGQMVAHALFSDAVAAAVLTRGGSGLEVCGVASLTDTSLAAHMTWDVTDQGFRMGLSPSVPEALAVHLAGFVRDLLAGHGLAIDEVDGWAVHPGGPHILDVAERELGLPASSLAASRRVLERHGNCSSPTVLLIVDDLRRSGCGQVVAMAFGPGLTIFGAVLRRS